MPPAITAFMNKLNANEKMVTYGAVLTVIAGIIGLVVGGGGWSFIAGIVVLAIYWLKYAPNQSMTWPAPIPTIVLIVSGLAALGALLALLAFLGLFAYFLGPAAIIVAIANAIGAGMMAWFAWKEYSAMPKMTPPSTPPAPPAPPAA
jgi:hypothetical protein